MLYLQKNTFIKKILLILFLFSSWVGKAQFQFSGSVNKHYQNATAYLEEVKNLKKRHLFIPENAIQQVPIKNNTFTFSGDFLAKGNRFYKIYLDNCPEGISNSKHLLNQCTDNISVLFIANNTDSIFFPLNDLNQIFCSFKKSREENLAIFKIDSIQENALIDLPTSKNDRQREIIYKKYFKKLQNYGKSLQEPLAELYAFCLYSDENSFSRKYYLKDIQSNDYYKQLSDKLQKNYDETVYINQFLQSIKNDSVTTKKSNLSNQWQKLIILFLVLSLLLNLYLLKYKKKQKLNFKIILTTQEQNVFTLMHQGNNNKQIAAKLFISISTVKTHINNIYSKLNITSRKQIGNFFK